ncbi:PIR protein [Plasmodium ovale]|uniref:PIR protein n=1 Tax=Plasmodium ovale TaxID=36330 RepID=A0A1D3JF26_PLAOA|nr:PIR protein [Plasmodium ovale]
MSSHGILGDDDLPEKDFDDKWKKETNFLEFENTVNSRGKINNMQKWIDDFDGKILNLYDYVYLDTFGNLEDKRCRDLNYYVNYIIHYIPEITQKRSDVADIIQRFKAFLKAKFKSWIKFKCTLKEEDYTNKMYLIKALDDFCENKKAFKKKLEKYDQITCCKYAKHVNERKSFFITMISNGQADRDNENFHFDEKCTLKDFGETFPDIICNEKDMSETKSNELPNIYSQGHLPEPIPEDSFNASPTKIALTSVSTIFGACLSGLYLYRHSFVGSMLRNIQKRNNISHEDAYEDVNGMFSEDHSHYINTPQANDRFYIAYNTTNN